MAGNFSTHTDKSSYASFPWIWASYTLMSLFCRRKDLSWYFIILPHINIIIFCSSFSYVCQIKDKLINWTFISSRFLCLPVICMLSWATNLNLETNLTFDRNCNLTNNPKFIFNRKDIDEKVSSFRKRPIYIMRPKKSYPNKTFFTFYKRVHINTHIHTVQTHIHTTHTYIKTPSRIFWWFAYDHCNIGNKFRTKLSIQFGLRMNGIY